MTKGWDRPKNQAVPTFDEDKALFFSLDQEAKEWLGVIARKVVNESVGNVESNMRKAKAIINAGWEDAPTIASLPKWRVLALVGMLLDSALRTPLV